MKMHYNFDDCPGICEKDKKYRPSFCDECEIGDLKKSFRSRCIAEIEKVFSEEETPVLELWKFEDLENDFYIISAIETYTLKDYTDPNWKTPVATMIAILRNERMRLQRIQNFEIARKQAEAANTPTR